MFSICREFFNEIDVLFLSLQIIEYEMIRVRYNMASPEPSNVSSVIWVLDMMTEGYASACNINVSHMRDCRL